MNDHGNNDEPHVSRLYIDLAKLLEAKRPPEKARKIERLLAGDTPVHEMIAEIDRIDAEIETEEYHPLPLSDTDEDTFVGLVRRYNLVVQEEADKNLARLKVKLIRNDFLSFLFVDFKKIIAFIKKAGRKTDLIRYTFLPPRLKPNRRIQYVFETVMQRQAGELGAPMRRVLSAGWMILTKFEYNLAARFARLVNEIIAVDFHLFDLTDDNLIDRIRDLELLFISCVYRSNYPSEIMNAVGIVVENNPQWKYRSAALRSGIARVLEQKQSRPSLHNLLLALNMVKYRRYFTLDDLVRSDNPEVINTVDFDCDAAVKKQIRDHLDKLVNDLSNQLKQKQEIDRITRFLPFSEEGGFDFRMLDQYYNGAEKSAPGSFEKDSETPAMLVEKYFLLLLHHFEAYLTDRIETDAGVVRVFSFDYFQYEITRVHMLLEKLGKFRFIFPKLTRERFYGIVSNRKTGTQTELEMMQVIGELVSTLKALVMKLVDIDRFHQGGADAPADVKPLEPAALIKRSVTLPSWDRDIRMPAALRGRQVISVLQEIGTLGTLMVVYLNDNETVTLIKKKDIIAGEISSLRENIERLATCIEFKKICDMYGI